MPPTKRSPAVPPVAASKPVPDRARPPAPSPPASPAPPAPGAGAFAPLVYTIPGAQRDRLLNTEWLLTNGLGGFAMGTGAGVPARRYHGLLVAATSPPGGRIMALSSIDERVVVGAPQLERTHALTSFRFRGSPDQLHPDGLSRLHEFEKALTCRWSYLVDDPAARLRIEKTVHLLRGVNAVQIRYHVERLGQATGAKPEAPVQLRLRPLAAMRDFHGLIRRASADRFQTVPAPGGCRVSLDGRNLFLQTDTSRFAADAQWWYDFLYQLDLYRGQDHLEDLFSPGEFVLTLPPGQSAAQTIIQASLEPMALADGSRDLTTRVERLGAMYAAATAAQGPSPAAADAQTVCALVTAADDFVVARRAGPGEPAEPERTTVIAGYPWFADWGRDTSIALPGLMLCTGRFDDARRTLQAFAAHRRAGIVPNVFDDRSGKPEYNTVDASLWFILGCCAYLTRTGDRATFDGALGPACIDIVSHYRRGTDFNIAMDPMDKLITAGTNATQLTWMDARRDGVTFTPRHGKAVEINALWHAALRELSAAVAPADAGAGANLHDLAEAVNRSFRGAFWNAADNCLFDVLTPGDGRGGGREGWSPSREIRPNQVFALSLPHSPLSPDQQHAVLACIRDRLLTPMGLRTLAPGSPGYRARYEGNLFERDAAYHNGTAWPYLLGPYAEAVLRVGGFSDAARREARAALKPLVDQMTIPSADTGGCIGQIAEIFDGESPQRSQGCPAQAWSVAETLRVWLML